MELRDRVVITPLITRVTVAGDDLLELDDAPGQDLMLAVPSGDGTTNRRYSIRFADREAGTVDLDVVVHGDGPGARWARDAAIGSSIAARGPRGKIVPVDDVAWHLFVCDESGWAATAAMVEALRPDELAVVVAETAGPEEHQPLDAPAALRLARCDRGGAPAGDPGPLIDAVGRLELPAGRGHAYLSAEKSVVRELRALLADRGLAPDEVSAKAYWRRDQLDAAYGEPARDDG